MNCSFLHTSHNEVHLWKFKSEKEDFKINQQAASILEMDHDRNATYKVSINKP